MAKELIRFARNWAVGVEGVLAEVFIPRHTRGTLRYVKAKAVLATISIVAAVEYLALVRWTGITAAAIPSPAGTQSELTAGSLKPIVADMNGYTITGTPTNTYGPVIDTEFERTFGPSLSDLEQRVMGIALLNKGPMSNHQQGWAIIRSSTNATLASKGFAIIEMVIEWPPNRSMPWKREHTANEENQ